MSLGYTLGTDESVGVKERSDERVTYLWVSPRVLACSIFFFRWRTGVTPFQKGDNRVTHLFGVACVSRPTRCVCMYLCIYKQ